MLNYVNYHIKKNEFKNIFKRIKKIMQIKNVLVALSVILFSQSVVAVPRRGGHQGEVEVVHIEAEAETEVAHGGLHKRSPRREQEVPPPFVEAVEPIHLEKRATKPQQQKGNGLGGELPGVVVGPRLLRRATKPQQRKGAAVPGPVVTPRLLRRAMKPQQQKGKGLGGELPGVVAAPRLLRRATKPQQRKGKVAVDGVVPVLGA